MPQWNPWHGCHKFSEGCQHCYVYRMDERHGKDASIVTRLKTMNLPIAKKRDGSYKIPSGEVLYTCFTSDFFVEEADAWRKEAWAMIKERSDLHFFMITKRIHRFMDCIPDDWEDGYENVTICCTMENQKQVDLRLPIYLKMPIKHKQLICEPLLSDIDFHGMLDESIEQITAGGESGNEARPCDYAWILHIREQCIEKGISFYFKQTGARFIKDGRLYRIQRKDQHRQARKAGINVDAQIPRDFIKENKYE